MLLLWCIQTYFIWTHTKINYCRSSIRRKSKLVLFSKHGMLGRLWADSVLDYCREGYEEGFDSRVVMKSKVQCHKYSAGKRWKSFRLTTRIGYSCGLDSFFCRGKTYTFTCTHNAGTKPHTLYHAGCGDEEGGGNQAETGVCKSFIWNDCVVFPRVLDVEPCGVFAKFWPVGHLPGFMEICGAHVNVPVTSWAATLLLVIPAPCSEEVNGGRGWRIRDPVEQGSARRGLHFPPDRIDKGHQGAAGIGLAPAVPSDRPGLWT